MSERSQPVPVTFLLSHFFPGKNWYFLLVSFYPFTLLPFFLALFSWHMYFLSKNRHEHTSSTGEGIVRIIVHSKHVLKQRVLQKGVYKGNTFLTCSWCSVMSKTFERTSVRMSCNWNRCQSNGHITRPKIWEQLDSLKILSAIRTDNTKLLSVSHAFYQSLTEGMAISKNDCVLNRPLISKLC